jgi:hypothetical protein
MKSDLAENSEIASVALDLWGATIENQWLKERQLKKHFSSFKDNGFFVLPIENGLKNSLLEFFNPVLQINFDVKTVGDNFFGSELSNETVAKLNSENIYYSEPSEEAKTALRMYLESIAFDLENQLGSTWQVVNIRAWMSKPFTNTGPNDWHIDGGPKFLRKIMIYPMPPSDINGTIEIYDRNNNKFLLQSNQSTCVLFDSSVLRHRGRPGKSQPRPAIEVTIAPGDTVNCSFKFEGQNARIYRLIPEGILDELRRNRYIFRKKISKNIEISKIVKNVAIKIKRKTSVKLKNLINLFGLNTSYASKSKPLYNAIAGLNIGGGPNFCAPGWMNLDGAASQKNPYPFLFSPNCTFPIPSGVVGLIYSSHCLEHLDDNSVERVLVESRRVISSGGLILLKLPDFEMVKKCLLVGKKSFFDQWDIESILPFWKNSGVPDNIENRASMIFCGYWNESYGDHFSGRVARNTLDAYHGPAKISKEKIWDLMKLNSCHAISAHLVNFINESQINHSFNHQNAWNADELEAILNKSGFRVETFDKEIICKKFNDVPGILEMKDISLYCLASLEST